MVVRYQRGQVHKLAVYRLAGLSVHIPHYAPSQLLNWGFSRARKSTRDFGYPGEKPWEIDEPFITNPYYKVSGPASLETSLVYNHHNLTITKPKPLN